jgi:hypothetical protein
VLAEFTLYERASFMHQKKITHQKMEPVFWWFFLLPLRPCAEALEWAKTQKTLKEAWQNCERGDWLLWLLGNTLKYKTVSYRNMILAATDCASMVARHVPVGERRPEKARAAARRWARNPTEANRKKAASAASAASASAAHAASASAAHAASASSAASAASASYASAYYASSAASLKRSANIVRKYFPKFPKIEV